MNIRTIANVAVLILTLISAGKAFAQVERITMGGALGQDIDLNGYNITGTGDISADDISASGILLGSAGLIALGTGSASAGDASTQPGTFSGGAAPTAGNLYGINIAKTGYENLMMGINKNTATGSVPANGAYISTYNSTGTITIGRGNTAGAPNSADIAIDASGNVSMAGQAFSSSGGLIAPLPGRLETAAAFTLEYGDRGSIIYVSTGSDLGPTTTITFSSAANFSQTAGLHDTMLIVNAGAGSIVFQSAGTESVRMSGGAVSGIATQYNQASLIFYDSATVYITGGIE